MKRNGINRQLREPTVRTAALYAGYISVIVCLIFMITHLYGSSAVIPQGREHVRPAMNASGVIYGVITIYVYTFILFCLNFYIQKRDFKSGTMRSVVSIVASILFIMIWTQALMFIQHYLFDFPKPDTRAMRGAFMRDMTLGSIVVFTSHITFMNYRRQLVMLENEALKVEYAKAKYESLKNQIDPHFLFNTLNTLNLVIASDSQLAQKYVNKLSSIFRYTIQSRDISSLRDELVFTKDYCDLMQIRYGENIRFVFDILDRYQSRLIAPFSVQTLVENAIKHNVITSKQPLVITVSTDESGSLIVSNPIHPKMEPELGEGIGLANLSERYKLRWGRDIVIDNNGERFIVKIPLIEESKNSQL